MLRILLAYVLFSSALSFQATFRFRTLHKNFDVIRGCIVDSRIFQEGSSWTWKFRAQSGDVLSWQRYAVLASNGSQFTVEVSKADAELPPQWVPTHRLEIEFNDIVEAHLDHEDEPHWDYRRYLVPNNEVVASILQI